MNKIFLLIFIGLMGALVYYHDNVAELLNPSQELNVVAVVNEEQIRLDEVEALYDMRHAHKSSDTSSAIQLQIEYAELLYDLIEQALVSQELERRNIVVENSIVDAYEEKIRSGYNSLGEMPEEDFIKVVEGSGINYVFWKSQLKNILELEALQHDMVKNIDVSQKEIENYLAQISDPKSSKIEFYIFKSQDRERLTKLKEREEISLKDFTAPNVMMEHVLLEDNLVPEEYRNELLLLENTKFAEIFEEQEMFYLLYIDKPYAEQKSEILSIYAMAERDLIEEKQSKIYKEWFSSIMSNSQIHLANDFLPKNLPNENLSKEIDSILQKNVDSKPNTP